MNNENLAEFKGKIVDIFEDYLDDNDVTLVNSEREDAIEDGEEDIAIIYGDHYDIIGNTVEQCVREHMKPYQAADNIMQSFTVMLKLGESDFNPPDEDIEYLRNSLLDVIIWHSCIDVSNSRKALVVEKITNDKK